MTSGISEKEIQLALARILESQLFSGSQQLRSLLEYIIAESLAGRAEKLKAYTIAIDALNQPDTFDPQNDPKVRLIAGRLRNSLELYYANEGADEPIIISIPKGRYKPNFEYRTTQPKHLEDTSKSAKSDTHFTGFSFRASVIVGVIGIILFAIWAMDFTSQDIQTDDGKQNEPVSSLPIVEVTPFIVSANAIKDELANGFRQQLIVELAHFKAIRVREVVEVSREEKLRHDNSTYILDGIFQPSGSQTNLNLKLTHAKDHIVVWSRQYFLPRNDEEYHEFLLDTVSEISIGLVSETGVISNDTLERLRQRLALLGNTATSDFECLILFHAFDNAKTLENETPARECLTRLTIADTKDSNIWASYALLRFLDWTKKSGPASHLIIDEALAAAQKAVRLGPNNAITYEYLGTIQAAVGNGQAAMASYEHGLKLNPSKPTLHFLVGWQAAVSDDWEKGIPLMRQGISLMPSPPGYMLIPLAIDAFRQGDFETSLVQAEVVAATGDQRGIALAFAAALALKDKSQIEKYASQLKVKVGFNPSDPIREIRKAFGNPTIFEKYDKVIADSNYHWNLPNE